MFLSKKSELFQCSGIFPEFLKICLEFKIPLFFYNFLAAFLILQN